jgi:hypothetical protein
MVADRVYNKRTKNNQLYNQLHGRILFTFKKNHLVKEYLKIFLMQCKAE